jgi:hypothetical protein
MHSEGIVTAILACGLAGGQVAKKMEKISCKGYRFPPEIIQQAIWLYVRFTLSFHDVEGLLAERGILVSYETIRGWVNHFGPMVAGEVLDVLVQSRRNKRAAIVAKRRWCLVLAAPHGIFNVQRRLTSARTHRAFRASATQTWHEVVAAV